MKLRVVCDINVSTTLSETIQRTGLTLCPDGSGLQVRIPNSPAIPKRKTKVAFIERPEISFDEIVSDSKEQVK